MKTIEDWANKTLTCESCGTDKSVKWVHNEKPFCNKCVIPVVLRDNQISLFDKAVED